jgi:hypothetical protein
LGAHESDLAIKEEKEENRRSLANGGSHGN